MSIDGHQCNVSVCGNVRATCSTVARYSILWFASFTFHLEHRVTVCTVVCTLAHQGCTVCRSAKGGWWPYWLRAHPGLIPKCVTVLYFPMHCTLSMMLIHKEMKNRISVSQISHWRYSGPLLVNTSMCHLKSERKLQHVLFVFQLWSDTRYIWTFIFAIRAPHPLGLVGVMSMSGLQLSHLIFYLLELRFWTHQNQVLPSLDGAGHTLEAADVISAIFLWIFLPTFLRCQLLVLQRCASQWRDAKESKATHCELQKRNWHYPIDKCVKKRTNFWRSLPSSRNSRR